VGEHTEHTEPFLAVGAAAASARYRWHTSGVAATWRLRHDPPNPPCDACRATMSQTYSGRPSTR